MLVLSRRLNQKVLIGKNITIKVLRLNNNEVRLGLEAPPEVRILRDEIARRMEAGEPLNSIEDDLDYREYK